MKDIFEMQYQLNSYTLCVNEMYPYKSIVEGSEYDPEVSRWFGNYWCALFSEFGELIDSEMNENKDNIIIELVDILHFLVSLSQIAHLSSEELKDIHTNGYNNLQLVFLKIIILLSQLQNCYHWKWWSKKEKAFDRDKAKSILLQLWTLYFELCKIYNCDFNKIKEAYILKNKVNYKRQLDGYNEDMKDEKDNQRIIEILRK